MTISDTRPGGAQAAPGTVLEGVRGKVFMDRYSLKDQAGKAIETGPEQMWRRVARGIAEVETTPELRAFWEERFYEAMEDFKFVPGGRILSGAGTGFEVTYYNCFQGDTLVHTREGIVPIGSLAGEHEVLSEGNVYRKAIFQSYGYQRLWEVVLANGTTFYATGDHHWVIRSNGKTKRVLTRDLQGKRIPVNARPAPARDADYLAGIRHGIVFGDGSVQYGRAHVCLFGESESLASYFEGYSAKSAGGTTATKSHVRVQGLPAAYKQLPQQDASASYWRGFVAGLLAADGHVDARGSVALYNKDADTLAQIADGMAIAGFVSSGITMTRETSPYDGSAKPMYRLQFFKATIEADDLLLLSHREHFAHSPAARHSTAAVISVRETDRIEEVFCCVEPETHTITIGHGYLTGQCYVIESPEDSRWGILDNLKYLTEIMARGGGVGVNLSTLRPRGSYIRSVNGTSSGPVSWAELYSVITGRVIQQGGTRRGALMIMLDDDHPDIEEFIAAKRIDPLTNKPVTIEHANVSVAVSDAFMKAVKENADWPLQFPTRAQVAANPELASRVEVKKTVKAREIWDLICTSAWSTAEPGLVFIDRYNTRSNTWYYENIRCVNPCVTGDTLVYTAAGLYPAAELAEIGANVGVVAPSADGVVTRQASHVFATGIKPVYRLQTTEGYSVRLTANHQVLTSEGWKEARNLTFGDKIELLNGEGGFGARGNEDHGRVLGWLVGDGYLNTRRQGSVTLCFFGRERTLAPEFAAAANRLVAAPEGVRRYHIGVQDIADRDESRVESVRLMRFVDPELLKDKLQVPPSVFRGAKSMQRGFLSALFTADGSVQGTTEKGVSIRLTSVSENLLIGVQRLLLNFGIASRLYKNRRTEQVRELPDGKGGIAAYPTQAYHDLVISRSNVPVFAEQIGFITDEKQTKLAAHLENRTRGFYREDFRATFDALTPDGEEMVYDLTEPEAHRFVANGLTVHNCGEQGLPPWGVCNLGALNLSAYVDGPIGAGTFDYAALERDSRIAMRFLDNVVDANLYFLEENAKAQLGTRRTGLGTMGLADALIKLGVAYGSPDAVEVIDRIYRTIRDAAYDMSADIAAEKGSCPDFDAEKYPRGQFIRELPDPIQAKIRAQGIRNAVLLTQAPTGTTSLLSGVSSGIEPVFSFAMRRVDRTGEHIMYHPLLQAWKDAHPSEETPGYFVSSSDLTPEGHIAVQARVQQYTDSSISKTVNAPNDHTVEEVKRLYLLAYDTGCKGVTYYRDGSRDAVLTHIKEEKKSEQPKLEPIGDPLTFVQGVIAQAQLDGRLAPLQAEELRARLETNPAQALPTVIRPRPGVLHGYTRNIKAPEGTVNITVNNDEDGPVEVFVNVGRAGSDVAALAEAMGRLVSLALRIPSPISQEDKLREVVSQLRGIGGSRTIGFGPEQVRSLPDAVGKALGEHLDGHPSLTPPPQQLPLLKGAATVAPTPMAGMPALTGPTTYFNGTNGDGLNVGASTAVVDLKGTQRMTGNLCPECGSSSMVMEEGCKKCYSCGFSEC